MVEGAAAVADLPHNNASQYTFIVTIKPANMAGQLNSGTILGASTKNNTAIIHFTPCHTIRPSAAAMAFKDAVREVNPLANSAAGTTTVIAPYIQDSQIEPLANQNATAVAKTSATSTCAINTRQTEKAG